MNGVQVLAVLPFLAILGGIIFANRVTPYLFGLPFILGWLVLSVVGTAVVTAVIYLADPANRDGAEGEP